jgi:predicted transcriptional regulator
VAANLFRKVLDEEGIYPIEVVRIAGLSKSTVFAVFRGKRRVKPATEKRLTDAINTLLRSKGKDARYTVKDVFNSHRN